jgi:competence protein ComEA
MANRFHKTRRWRKSVKSDTAHSSTTNPYYSKKKENIIIDINTANPENLKRVRGIGEVLSKRIVNYREALGGFYDKNQIKEVYGINDSIYNVIENQMVIKRVQLRKVNFNEASFEELKRHPYISDLLAKQIISFREKVKPFESEQDVQKLYLMKEDLYSKLHNYIEF